MTNYEFRAVFMRFHLYFHACFDEIIKSVFSYLRRLTINAAMLAFPRSTPLLQRSIDIFDHPTYSSNSAAGLLLWAHAYRQTDGPFH